MARAPPGERAPGLLERELVIRNTHERLTVARAGEGDLARAHERAELLPTLPVARVEELKVLVEALLRGVEFDACDGDIARRLGARAELGAALREVVHLLRDALVVEEAGLVSTSMVRGLHPLGVRRPERDHAVLELRGARHGHGLRGGIDRVASMAGWASMACVARSMHWFPAQGHHGLRAAGGQFERTHLCNRAWTVA